MSRRNLVGPLVGQVDARPTTVVKAFVVSMMLTEFSSAATALSRFQVVHFKLLVFFLLLQHFMFRVQLDV